MKQSRLPIVLAQLATLFTGCAVAETHAPTVVSSRSTPPPAIIEPPAKNVVTDTFDGPALDTQFTREGIAGRMCIDISKDELSQIFVSPGGAKLTLSANHRWRDPVTLRAFDAHGIPAYSMEAMVSQQDQAGAIKETVLPIGAGTIYKVFGKVQLLGNTINADGPAPLIFVVHNAKNTDDAKPGFTTNGPLAPIKFKLADNPVVASQVDAKDVYLQLVHIGGKGSAVLKDGKRITFN